MEIRFEQAMIINPQDVFSRRIFKTQDVFSRRVNRKFFKI